MTYIYYRFLKQIINNAGKIEKGPLMEKVLTRKQENFT